MGSFVVDLAFRTPRLPAWGETVIGSGFAMGPGGKGSNQAVAAARLGAHVTFLSRLGRDPFGELARKTYREEGIHTEFVFESERPTGGASIVIDDQRGENSIVVFPGASFHISSADIDRSSEAIRASKVFLSQLETDLAAVEYGLALARRLGVTTILNPAPAATLNAAIYAACDYLTPNETEASLLTGREVRTIADAEAAADVLLSRGVRNVIVTLGAQGAFIKNHQLTRHVSAVDAGPVVETTGAGDAFNGGLAVALAEGIEIEAATRFACAVAGISVTRPGTAPAMPRRNEVDTLIAKSVR